MLIKNNLKQSQHIYSIILILSCFTYGILLGIIFHKASHYDFNKNISYVTLGMFCIGYIAAGMFLSIYFFRINISHLISSVIIMEFCLAICGLKFSEVFLLNFKIIPIILGIVSYTLFFIMMHFINCISNHNTISINIGFALSAIIFGIFLFSLLVYLINYRLVLIIVITSYLIVLLIFFTFKNYLLQTNQSIPVSPIKLLNYIKLPIISSFISGYLKTALYGFIAIYIVYYGISKYYAVTLNTYALATNIFGPIILGIINDKFHNISNTTLSIGIIIGITSLYYFVDNKILIIVILVTLHMLSWGFFIAAFARVNNQFKNTNLLNANAFLLIFYGIGGISGIKITKVLVKIFSESGFVISVSFICVSFLLLVHFIKNITFSKHTGL